MTGNYIRSLFTETATANQQGSKKIPAGILDKFFIPYIQYGLEEKSKHSERTKLQDKDDLPGSVHKNRSLGHFDCFPPINKSWKKKRNFYAK